MKIEKLKQYIKENKCEKFFFEGLREKTIEEKYQYLKNHFTYNIMNSWNDLKSIANNVKIYNLGLTKEQENKFFELLNVDGNEVYNFLNFDIKDFEELTETEIFYNGRSDGYLVIVPKFDNVKRWEHIFDWLNVSNIQYFDTYKEYKQEQNKYNGGCYYQELPTNYSRKEEIEQAYYLIKAFDKLCDILRSNLIYILNNAEIKEEIETIEQTVKYITIE